jgi:hypothetical protein
VLRTPSMRREHSARCRVHSIPLTGLERKGLAAHPSVQTLCIVAIPVGGAALAGVRPILDLQEPEQSQVLLGQADASNPEVRSIA